MKDFKGKLLPSLQIYPGVYPLKKAPKSTQLILGDRKLNNKG